MTTDILVKFRQGDHILTGTYDPGNSTRYTAMAVRLWGAYSLGSLGRVTDGWLVVNGNNGMAYLFQGNEKQPLKDVYIQEKLGGREEDYPHLGDLIRKLTGRPGGEKR